MWTLIRNIGFLLCAFNGGMWLHEYLYGEVRVFTNMEIPGDKLNRGQKTIDVMFPHDLKPNYLMMPGHRIYPDDNIPRWVEILPGGAQKTWIDRLSFEIVEPR